MASAAWEEAYELIKPKIAALKALIESIDWGVPVFGLLQKLWEAAGEAVLIVEFIATQVAGLTSEEKKKLATYAVDEAVSLPFYLEWADGPAISFMIDRIVALMNKKTASTAKGVSFVDITGIVKERVYLKAA